MNDRHNKRGGGDDKYMDNESDFVCTLLTFRFFSAAMNDSRDHRAQRAHYFQSGNLFVLTSINGIPAPNKCDRFSFCDNFPEAIGQILVVA